MVEIFHIPKPRRIKYRIMGSENEFNVSSPDLQRVQDSVLDSFFPKPLPKRRFGTNVILKNQAKVYPDVRAIEYATPESLGAEELALYETAGLSIFEEASDQYSRTHKEPLEFYKTDRNCQRFQEKGITQLFKASSGSSHASYLTFAHISIQKITSLLVPFLLTRWMLIGNGWIDIDLKGKLTYLLSQRADITGVVVSGSSTGDGVTKPIISSREEPHSDGRIWRRYHDVSGNQNMSEWQLYLKYATTDLLFMLIEEPGFLDEIPCIVNSEIMTDRAMAKTRETVTFFNADIFGKTRFRLEDGREWSALDVHRFCIEKALCYFKEERGSPTKERKHGLEFWIYITDALARKDLPILAKYLDWAAILYYIFMPVLDRAGIDPEIFINPQKIRDKIALDHTIKTKKGKEVLLDYFQQILMNYARVHVSKSPYGVLLKNRKIEKMFSEEQVLMAKKEPPKTRASFREKLMCLPDQDADWTVQSWDWSYITMQKGWARTLKNLNPYRSRFNKEDLDMLYTQEAPKPPPENYSDTE